MPKKGIQDVFLETVILNKIPVTVFLTGGVKLMGIITHMDDQTVLLQREGHAQLVYKSGISTIMPAEAISL
ncbi:MAG: RNA chaperone Hfq [Lactobacillales bacterium]|jgi:host factor-I protein|nr:RNA chaperone Hfq [Lactobacillales bacterium]